MPKRFLLPKQRLARPADLLLSQLQMVIFDLLQNRMTELIQAAPLNNPLLPDHPKSFQANPRQVGNITSAVRINAAVARTSACLCRSDEASCFLRSFSSRPHFATLFPRAHV